MCGGLLSNVPSLTSCSSLQLPHVCPPGLPHAPCTCPRHEERLGEGGKEEVDGQPCSQLCDQVPRMKKCARASSVPCGVTHKLQLPPTAPCTSAKATPCSLLMSETRREAGGGWEGGGPWAATLTAVRPSATYEEVCQGVLCAVWGHSQAAAPSNCFMCACKGCSMPIAHVRDTERG